jgi:Fe2+ transport system protein FeoA
MKKKLSDFKNGDQIKIKSIACGANFNRRLLELGLFEGSEVKIIKNDNHSPLILGIFDSKVAIGKAEAEKIYGEKI